MHSELLNLSLFAFAIAKVAVMTGFGAGIVLLGMLRATQYLRLRGPQERRSRRPAAFSFCQRSSGDGQLASRRLDLIPANKCNRATSPSRKVRHA
jgi:hypothetical protein